MSNPEIFIVGVVITLLLTIALVPLIWAAVLDGRDQEAFSRARAEAQAHDTASEASA